MRLEIRSMSASVSASMSVDQRGRCSDDPTSVVIYKRYIEAY